MNILIVRVSSLGDVLHNMPLLADLHRHFPDAHIDWVVEEAYTDLVRLNQHVRTIIPIALRRWRRQLTSASARAEIAAFYRRLRAVHYDLVLDTQGLLKTGLVMRMAKLAPAGRPGECDQRFRLRAAVAAVPYRQRAGRSACACGRARPRGGGAGAGLHVNKPIDFSLNPPLPGAAAVEGDGAVCGLFPRHRPRRQAGAGRVLARDCRCIGRARFAGTAAVGSVVPLFRQQIREGGPITLTHKDVTRYFMTIPEAAQLVIQAGAMATGRDVFVLDMGTPVKIIDLACKMIKLSGLAVLDEKNPKGDISIHITGMRPGEKLCEEFLIGENRQSTEHVRIMKAHEDYLPWDILSAFLDQLFSAAEKNNIEELWLLMSRLVSGYQLEKTSSIGFM